MLIPTPLPLILAHGPGSLGEALLLPLMALLIPACFVAGILLPPVLILQPSSFRPAGLPPLQPKVRRSQRRRRIAGLVINLVTFLFWSSLFVPESRNEPNLLLFAVAAFLGAEAFIFLLRWHYCKHCRILTRQTYPSCNPRHAGVA